MLADFTHFRILTVLVRCVGLPIAQHLHAVHVMCLCVCLCVLWQECSSIEAECCSSCTQCLFENCAGSDIVIARDAASVSNCCRCKGMHGLRACSGTVRAGVLAWHVLEAMMGCLPPRTPSAMLHQPGDWVVIVHVRAVWQPAKGAAGSLELVCKLSVCQSGLQAGACCCVACWHIPRLVNCSSH
jgi:hypothetical protein